MANQDTNIFQEIDETDPEQCLQEVERLIPKLRAFNPTRLLHTMSWPISSKLVEVTTIDLMDLRKIWML